MAGAKTVTVLAPGQRVAVPDADLTGVLVLSVAIRGETEVQYEVAYWKNGERKTTWADSREVTPDANGAALVIGFKG